MYEKLQSNHFQISFFFIDMDCSDSS